MSKAQGTQGDTVIRASAGTGKTFQLSNRFIGLAARQAPDNILATTFTRKAAGEILDRVLVRLAEAARSRRSSSNWPSTSMDRRSTSPAAWACCEK